MKEIELVATGFVAGARLRPPRRDGDVVRVLLPGDLEIRVSFNDPYFDAQLVGPTATSRVFGSKHATRLAYSIRLLKQMADVHGEAL